MSWNYNEVITNGNWRRHFIIELHCTIYIRTGELVIMHGADKIIISVPELVYLKRSTK